MVELPADQGEVVAGYLGTHFPVRPATEAVLIPGETQVSIKEWLLPSLGSRPHDPLAALVDWAVVQQVRATYSVYRCYDGILAAREFRATRSN
jgi:hypothetical protein